MSRVKEWEDAILIEKTKEVSEMKESKDNKKKRPSFMGFGKNPNSNSPSTSASHPKKKQTKSKLSKVKSAFKRREKGGKSRQRRVWDEVREEEEVIEVRRADGTREIIDIGGNKVKPS